MENVFNIKYNTELDRSEMPKESYNRRIKKFILDHKLFNIAVGMFIILSAVNFYLVFSFMKILGNI